MNYFIYIDENGQPFGLKSGSSKYFILSGFLVKGSTILHMEEDLKRIKIKYNIFNEIKFSNSYKRMNLNFSQFIELKRELSKYINQFENSVVGVVINKKNFYNLHTSGDIYETALRLLMERFQMEVYSRHHGNVKNIPITIFADSRKNNKNKNADMTLQKSYKKALLYGTRFLNFTNYTESMVFIDSEDSTGIQFVDHCAGLFGRAFEKGDKNSLYTIYNAIRKNSNNQPNGYGIKIL